MARRCQSLGSNPRKVGFHSFPFHDGDHLNSDRKDNSGLHYYSDVNGDCGKINRDSSTNQGMKNIQQCLYGSVPDPLIPQ